jgi:hypothetical protein
MIIRIWSAQLHTPLILGVHTHGIQSFYCPDIFWGSNPSHSKLFGTCRASLQRFVLPQHHFSFLRWGFVWSTLGFTERFFFGYIFVTEIVVFLE